MTRAETKWAVLLASLPSVIMIAVGVPTFWLLKDTKGNDWLFWIFVGLIPFSFASGVFGALCSFERSLPRGARACLLLLNAAAVCFGLYLAVLIIQAFTAWKNFHPH